VVYTVTVEYGRSMSIHDPMMTSVYVGLTRRHCFQATSVIIRWLVSTVHSQQSECTPDSQECTPDTRDCTVLNEASEV